MKIAVTATAPTLDATIDPRFGRCSYFIIIETNDMSFEAIENTSVSSSGGAGIQAAQTIAIKGAKLLITGNIGPNAYKTLNAANIDVIASCNGIVSEAIANYQAGVLKATTSANVESHAGING
ncbi:MAG: NifB/NifX family molybdenum-iron cluster-binding protein [Deltaproteobacteria bacterium]|nr:NifB/NifX family molybdenum-iron cluster-binding protein [Deltaproteobacteria bacterium]